MLGRGMSNGAMILLLVCFGVCAAQATTYYVDGAKGDDSRDGRSISSCFATIQKAADIVQAGDTVVVQPGVYFEHVRLAARGTRRNPITFKADRVAKGRVVITGADRAIREKKSIWKLDDAGLQLYSVAYTGEYPARVLYSGIDLYPYRSLEALRKFEPAEKGIGPKHGYTYDQANGKLYVRLHPNAEGTTDPNKHVMSVAPGTGEQYDGTFITKPTHYNLGVLGEGDAHVVIDGFTFETPGMAGVYVEANYVTVRNCWFLGCRSGVGGNYTEAATTDPTGEDYFSMKYDPQGLRRSAGHITIEYCDFTQFPVFQDAKEVLLEVGSTTASYPRYFWWTRKSVDRGMPSERLKYEIGIASRIGRDWEIRHNRVENVFDGLSCHAMLGAADLRIHDNLFQNVVDNAVECEEHSRNIHIYRNLIIDAFDPISWQPLKGTPWPGPIYVDGNVILNTPENADLWKYAVSRGIFKIGPTAGNWTERNPHMQNASRDVVEVPKPGFLVFNNTVYFPGGKMFNIIGGFKVDLRNVKFFNNIFATDTWLGDGSKSRYEDGHGPFFFANNVCAPATADASGPGVVVAGEGGQMLANLAAIGMNDPAAGDVSLQAGSPALWRAIKIPRVGRSYPNIGAWAEGWSPPDVGPRVTD